jgi:hypothetical protein
MGSSQSTNVLNDQTNILFNTITNVMQDCSSKVTGGQNVSVDHCSNVVVNGIKQTQYISVNVNCIQNATASKEFDTTIQQTIQQMSKALNQAVSFNPGSTEANNTTNLVTNYVNTIKDTFVQNCATQLSAMQNVSCSFSNNITFNAIDQTQALNFARTCTMNSTDVVKAKTALTQHISQSATSTVESILSGLLGAILLVLIIAAAVVFIFFQSSGSVLANLTNPLFLCALVLIGAVLAIIGYFFKWWPYKKVSDKSSSDDQAAAKKRNYTILALATGLAALDAVFIYILYGRGTRLSLKKSGRTEVQVSQTA